ncbi:LacI family DNA-binding transcriptional regulator [Levilactobacillus enshiensis]|uniref:LacI family DNA-binding transcriptional regulator n=1 Tax=Levilactobacillus enshiensis TaxID=2590213 RepID=UPI00117B1542|nr:LacI family DNA-binding transcriptional regulator [Levilactobacillus enshiensis]
MATIKEIAQKSGYSSATVSRFLNDDPTFSISEKAQQRIMRVANELNYHHEDNAKRSQYQIAVLFSVDPQKELEDSYFSSIRQNIIAAGKAADMDVQFYRHVQDVPQRIDGLIALGPFTPADIQAMKKLTVNTVFTDVNPDPHAFNSVQPNYESMVHVAIDTFRRSGITSIGLIGGKFWHADFPDDPRTTYFESYMRELGIFDDRFVLIGEAFSVHCGYQMGLKLVAMMAQQPLPKGFIVASDPLAVGVLQAFNENKVTVPVDTAIISVNDIDIAKYVSPPLTTFRIDTTEIARSIISTLRDGILFPTQAKREIRLDCELIQRKSFVPQPKQR